MLAAAVSHQNPSHPRAGRTDPLCLGVMGAPVPADKEPLDCAGGLGLMSPHVFLRPFDSGFVTGPPPTTTTPRLSPRAAGGGSWMDFYPRC